MKRWEYRNIHLLLAPVYLRMVLWCIRHCVTPFGLLKADYALDHGGASFASKYAIQMVFSQRSFPPTKLLLKSDGKRKRLLQMIEFAESYGFPIILKPDIGRIGFGVTLIHGPNQADEFLAAVNADYIVQQYVSAPLEFGVFYIRQNGVPDVFGINSKDFPAVTGDGVLSVRDLIRGDERLSRFENLFNQNRFEHIPAAGETVVLSVVGSHTLGCVFRDVTHLRTPALVEAVDRAVGIPGFNYGRLDVRTTSIEAFQRGEFTVIEVNGVDSLATNAFDPTFSYRQGLRWFTAQFRLLVEIAAEHKSASMPLLSKWEFVRRVAHAEKGIGKIGSLLHFASAEIEHRGRNGVDS